MIPTDDPFETFEIELYEARSAATQARLMFQAVQRQLLKAGHTGPEVGPILSRLLDLELMLLKVNQHARELGFIHPEEVPDAAPAGESIH